MRKRLQPKGGRFEEEGIYRFTGEIFFRFFQLNISPLIMNLIKQKRKEITEIRREIKVQNELENTRKEELWVDENRNLIDEAKLVLEKLSVEYREYESRANKILEKNITNNDMIALQMLNFGIPVYEAKTWILDYIILRGIVNMNPSQFVKSVTSERFVRDEGSVIYKINGLSHEIII